MTLIDRALDMYSDLDEGEIVEVEDVAKMIFELVERIESDYVLRDKVNELDDDNAVLLKINNTSIKRIKELEVK